MSELEKRDQVRINEIVAVVKFISLLFCLLIIYNNVSVYNYKLIDSVQIYFSIHPMGELSLFIILTYLLWSLSYFTPRKYSNKYVLMIEDIVFVVMFSALIALNGSYIYEYKLLFIFIIIASTLQGGMRHGIIIAVVSSIMIFATDLAFFQYKGLDIIFQDDSILSGVFVLIAWPMGFYVKIREENLREKSIKLNELNYQLMHQNKERRYIEEILIRNQECYSLIIENSKDAIFVHSNDNLIFVNDSALKFVGFTMDEIEDKRFIDFVPEEEKIGVEEVFNNVINKNQNNVKFEGTLINRNGQRIAVESISNYITYNGAIAIMTIVHDISYEKEIEQLKINVKRNFELLNKTIKLNNSITELFVNMSHELKTPLNVIFSALQVLIINNEKEDDVTNKNIQYYYVMKQNCYRLMKLINNFLMLTKLDSGVLQIKLENEDIVKRVEDITLSVAEYNRSRNVDIIFDTDIEEKIIAFDSELIGKVMLNLLSNAVKYSSNNGEIFVKIWNDSQSVYISVKDNGVGIPEDKIQFIFERFGQVDKTLARQFEGTGIGLSIVKALIDMHEGNIEIKSGLGNGSEFIIRLPDRRINSTAKDEFKNEIFETDMEKIFIEFSDIY